MNQVLAALVGTAMAGEEEVTPLEKVVTMLEDLQTEVIVEGKAEAKTYDKFACFCKDMSEEKAEDITDAQDEAADLLAKVNQLTADRDGLDEIIAEQQEFLAVKEKVMEEEKAKRRKEHEVFQVNLNDCYTAVKEIDWAVVELKA